MVPAPTHLVENQPAAPAARNLWGEDAALRDHAAAAGADGPHLARFAAQIGRRLDEVGFTDGYHRLMALGLSAGYAAAPWTGGSHLEHAAMVYLHSARWSPAPAAR
jgi:putative acyl-CoA dehydrogenase